MSVSSLSPEKKFKIVESFFINANKTKTAEMYCVSARTVGRIVKEYEWVMSNPAYKKIYIEKNILVMPSDQFVDDEVATFISISLEEIENEIHKEFQEAMERNLYEELEEELETSDDYNWNLIATAKSITVTRTNQESSETDSVEIAKGSENFRSAWAIIRKIDMSDEDQVSIASDEIFTMADPKSAIEKFSQGKLTVNVKEECVYYDGTPIHNSLTSRVISMVTMNGIEGTQSLINFLEKLMENPSYRAVNSLYDFMQHNDIEINSEGNFYAWKRVRSDFTDCFSGTFDNSVGAEPEMPRNMVNEDPSQTCSRGLHVAAKHYLNHFHGEVVIKCEVNPKDCVSCPFDYNFAKLRTCKYKVVEDVTNQFSY